MCGIWACIGPCAGCESAATQKEFLRHIALLEKRGPECTRTAAPSERCLLGFCRLAINGLTDGGMQPMTFATSGASGKSVTWVCNGEIFNHSELEAEYGLSLTDKHDSDCGVIGFLYEAIRSTNGIAPTDALITMCRSLDGYFALAIADTARGELIVARDPFGVRPLFTGYNSSTGQRLFASEIKGLHGLVDPKSIDHFPPGSVQVYSLTGSAEVPLLSAQYHAVPWLQSPVLAEAEAAKLAVRTALEEAVSKRLMSDRPVAALLSGGIDSSLIAALTQRFLKERTGQRLRTFSIGMPGSEDLKYARIVADHIGSDHTEVTLTADDFFSVIPDVVRDIESFDITTVRASVGNWLVCREIARQSECKVVFNGDGSDETFGSYLYFLNAPSSGAFEGEVTRLLTEISYFDVLRSDRSIASHGLDARTPFLDKQFVAVARAVATKLRRPCKASRKPEKWILRAAFAGTGTLPDCVLWRTKEAFSDGVSSSQQSWFQDIQARLTTTDLQCRQLGEQYAHLPPPTPEALYYRQLFEQHYPGAAHIIPHFWMPKWSGDATDPSARTLKVYDTVQTTQAPTDV